MHLRLVSSLILWSLAGSAFAQAPAPRFDAGTLKEWPWRLLGPSAPAGRAWTVVGVPSDPRTLYVTTAGGGLWKTSNNGTTFVPVFEFQSVASTGAVAIAESNPNVVWLGTGEPASTRANSWGDGVYKSTDGARTWSHMGLPDSRQIGAIIIHPKNPEVVYVAAMGHHWGRNAERGVYKTTDGGKTWTKALYVDDVTGFIDLQMDPHDPEVIYAAAWQRHRFGDGDMDEAGPGSGIYKTTDGGRTWKRLTQGLPSDEMGKIHLAVGRKNPRIVYAAVLTGEPAPGGKRTSDQGGVFRSEDGGASWTRVNPLQTSYYYQRIYTDPADDNTVWMPVFELNRSTDGGRTFEKVNMRHVHNDLHSMWIDPADSRHIALSGDGGVNLSYDRGATWQQTVLPIGQFYEVAVDDQDPYSVFGGMQDTGHWRGPSRTYDPEGITARDWIKLRHNGDGMGIAADPRDSDVIYMVQEFGNTSRLDLRTWERRELQPDPEAAKQKGATHEIRWDWTPAFTASLHAPGILYLGSNYLFRIDARNGEFEVVSPDLSKQQETRPRGVVDGYHSYGALFSVDESSFDENILWAGADDGPIWVTRDRGAHWSEVSVNLPKDAPTHCVVSKIEASRHSPDAAYVAYDCHAWAENVRPYLYKTSDFGRSWTQVVGDLPARGSTYVIREDPVNSEVLYVGTEFGVSVTIDGGRHWVKLNGAAPPPGTTAQEAGRLPTVAVRALAIQERDLELVAGTFGRAIWVTDISPFQEMTAETLREPVHLFTPRAATLYRERETYGSGIEELNGDMYFRAETPPPSATFTYTLREAAPGEVTVKVADAQGTLLRTLRGPGSPGIHRVIWDLKREPEPSDARVETPERTPSDRDFRARVSPGVYAVTIEAGKGRANGTVVVRPEPGPRAPRFVPASLPEASASRVRGGGSTTPRTRKPTSRTAPRKPRPGPHA